MCYCKAQVIFTMKKGKCQHGGGSATNHFKCQTILIAQLFSEQERRQKVET